MQSGGGESNFQIILNLKEILRLIVYALFIGILLVSCRPNQAISTTSATVTGNPTEAQPGATRFAPATGTLESPQPGAALSPTETKKAAATKTNYTATPDTRLKPEQWQKWPYVPTISARAIEIYKKGLAMGTDPHSFSIAGDCQSIVGAFLDNMIIPTDINWTRLTTISGIRSPISKALSTGTT